MSWQLLLIPILIAVNGFFALAEIALVTVRPTQIDSLVERGVGGARRLKRLAQDSSRFLSTIQVAITLSGFLASASATTTLARPLGDILSTIGLPDAWSQGASVLVITSMVSYLSLVFAELVPKQLGLRWPQSLALRVAGPVAWFGSLLHPFVVLLTGSTRLVLKLFRVDSDQSRSRLSEEELRRLVAAHHALKNDEKEMIDAVFNFGDAVVREMMIPRRDVVALEADTPVEDAVTLVRQTGYSRFPVYEGELDRINGIVTAKELLTALVDGGKEIRVRDLSRRTLIVPETKKAAALLDKIRREHIHLTVVVDEYGGTAGIVTAEDLLEEIVGDIQDETDPEPERRIESAGNNEFVVDAGLRLEEVNQRLGVELITSDAYETLAGFLLAQLQRFPDRGETLNYEGLRFTIEDVENHRIERVRITRLMT